jgi:hypothetical protein
MTSTAKDSAINSGIEDCTVTIIVDGKLTRFDYDDLKSFHKGDSWFGCTVGFRAMQLAARELSQPAPWSRDDLAIVSGHPGPGVKDAIELITATVSSGNFQLHENIDNKNSNSGCNSNMRFEWWVTENDKTIHIKLRAGIVPESFLQLLDRLNAGAYPDDDEKNKDLKQFDLMKQALSTLLWNQSLDASFDANHVTTPTNNKVKKLC